MVAPLLGAIGSYAIAEFKDVFGPRLEQTSVELRSMFGWNDRGRARRLMWNQIFGSTRQEDERNYAPENISFADALKLFNCNPYWQSAAFDAERERAVVDDLWWSLRFNGVVIDRETLDGQDRGGTASRDDLSKQWSRLIQMSSPGAALPSVIRDYYRGHADTDDVSRVDINELDFNFQRSEIRRRHDRNRLMKPYWNWAPEDGWRLFWLGLIDPGELDAILKAGGMGQSKDTAFQEQLVRQLPPSDLLVTWMRRDLWNGNVATLYGLDDGYNDSPVAKFFAERQGVNWPAPGLPNEPDGEKDWLKLAYRASCPLPMFGEAIEMQRRLRPAAGEGQASVVPGVQAWTEQNTRDMLDIAGYSAPIRDRLMALATEPLNVRIIQNVLLEAVKHPQIARDAQAAFGEGVDWVLGVYLDHGFSPAIAKLAADGVRAKADDEANAERIEEEKAQRAAKRKNAIEYYRVGLTTAAICRLALVGPQFTDAMAVEAVEEVDREIALSLARTQIGEIEIAYKAGKVNMAAVGAQLQNAGVTPDRQATYVQEWVWERNEQARMLATGEIISAVKAGLILPSAALTRMVNLGWNGPDALVEIAAVENEIAQAQARALATATSKSLAQQAAAARKLAAEQKAAEAAATKAAKAKAAAAKNAATATLEQERLAEKYDASALMDWDAYNKAEAKGDKSKAQAELDKMTAAFQTWLIDQAQLRQKPGVTSGQVGGIEDKQQGDLDAATPTSTDPTKPASPATPVAGTGSGAGSAAPAT